MFAAATAWEDALIPFGWAWVGGNAAGTGYWRRPGKRDGVSATSNHDGTDRLFVFSSNAAPLETGRWYTRFQAYSVLVFGGDFVAAARTIGRAWK
ncbi:MAG: hypothetical protein JWO38_8221 [Gemmataceae bacterium]|nr:hypothetical protein [Gemmataceae bacterium]